MTEDKMYLINKIFQNDTIRTVWDKDEEKYYVSVIDIVGNISRNKDPQSYWRKLKQRLKEACLSKRIKTLQERKQLTNVWKENGITQNYKYSILTNKIYKTWSNMTNKEYKQYKNLRKENLRDNMDNIELILTDLSEETTKRLTDKQKTLGLKENIKVAKKDGNIAKIARKELENKLGESVITKDNKLNYEYIDLIRLK